MKGNTIVDKDKKALYWYMALFWICTLTALFSVDVTVWLNYDKLGHFMQGITPYLATKELLIKRKFVKRGAMQVFLCISVSMAVSAMYELFEYGTTLVSSDFATDFVASQGDPFDTQKDMLFAFIGAIFAACFSVNYRYAEEKSAPI